MLVPTEVERNRQIIHKTTLKYKLIFSTYPVLYINRRESENSGSIIACIQRRQSIGRFPVSIAPPRLCSIACLDAPLKGAPSFCSSLVGAGADDTAIVSVYCSILSVQCLYWFGYGRKLPAYRRLDEPHFSKRGSENEPQEGHFNSCGCGENIK